MTEKLYTVAEVAEIISMTRKWVYSIIDEKKLKVVRLGPQTIRVAESALEEFIQARK